MNGEHEQQDDTPLLPAETREARPPGVGPLPGTNRTRRLIRALLVIAAVVTAMGTLVWYGRPRPTPWDRLETAANSFPIPESWSAEAFNHNHGDCSRLDPACVPNGYVVKNVHAPPGTTVTCDQLASLVDEWKRRGFVIAGDQQASGPIPCQFHGVINGVAVGAQSIGADGIQIGAFDVPVPPS